MTARLIARLVGGRRGLFALGIVAPFASPLYAPQLLAFPHRAATPIGTVWSETPIRADALAATSAAVQSRMATTPLAEPVERRPIFLTDGGWRWTWLAVGAGSSFALSRPFTKAVVVNRTNLVGTGAVGSSMTGRKRTLHSLLAHEFTHGLIRRRFGVVPSLRFPAWKVEGYADHVAGESTLDAEAVARLEAAGQGHPALVYYCGRQKVEAELENNGGDVAGLFASTP